MTMTRSILYQLLIFILGITILVSCVRKPDFPIEPQLTFVGMNDNVMVQNSFNTDSLIVTFSFTDGDGDIGSDTSNIFVVDTRDQFKAASFFVDDLPEEGASRGIEGEISLTIYTTCCIFPDGTPPCQASLQYPTDTLQYEIYMVDRAGNESNRIRTNPIIILCQ